MKTIANKEKVIKLTAKAVFYNAIVHKEYLGLSVEEIKRLNSVLIQHGVLYCDCKSEFKPYFNDNSDLLIDYEFIVNL